MLRTRLGRRVKVDTRPPATLRTVNFIGKHAVDIRVQRIKRREAEKERVENESTNLKSVEQLPGTSRDAISVLNELKDKDVSSSKKKKILEVDWMVGSNRFKKRKTEKLDHTQNNDESVSYTDPPHGVLGAGKGVDGSLPEFEFHSIWQHELPEFNSKNPAPWIGDPAAPPRDLKLAILSVVASVSLGSALDLEHIAKVASNLHYSPTETFTPLVMRLRKPKATALIFSSGKMVVTGTQSEDECRVASRRFGRLIQKLGYRVSIAGIQIQNISATCSLGFKVRVHLFAKDKLLGTQIGYHPELFTGVSIPLTNPKVKVIIFRTGSVLITGARTESELYEGLRIVYPFAKIYAN